MVVAGAASVNAWGGPWSQLPEAVDDFQNGRAGAASLRVLSDAEESVRAEARAGNLRAVHALMEVYFDLVGPLEDGRQRVDALSRSVSLELERYGSRSTTNPARAGAAWVLAGYYHLDSELEEQLRDLLLPPAQPEPGEVWVSPFDSAELVWQPPLRYQIGCTTGDRNCHDDERALRWITVNGFWIERTEVTNDRYRRCVETERCEPPRVRVAYDDRQRGSEPVVGVNWTDARSYAAWAGRRLPSEAEWERAARGQWTDRRYPWGEARYRTRANTFGSTGVDRFERAAPVGSFSRNGWNLFDMAGNVWEWCQDPYLERLSSLPDDGRPYQGEGLGRVLRGGSWRRSIELSRVSSRTWEEPDYWADDVGFRTVGIFERSVNVATLLALGDRVYHPISIGGWVLAANSLDSTDRTYLARRSVTWLVLEGRAWEALPAAVSLLVGDPQDLVALGLVKRLENDLLEAAVSGRFDDLINNFGVFRSALAGRGELVFRVVEVKRRAVRQLRQIGFELQERGDEIAAAEHLAAAQQIQPTDREIARLRRALVRLPGEKRTWPGDGRTMVWVPPGKYMMGWIPGDELASPDEGPNHAVEVVGFWIDRAEVSNAEFQRCVNAGGCVLDSPVGSLGNPRLAGHPVVGVTWYQAREYCAWAEKRLLTEAEWERAARAGERHLYPWGNNWDTGLLNGYGLSEGDQWPATAPNGSFVANRWGIVDIVGNASEWVEDRYHPSFLGATRDGRPWNQLTGDDVKDERVVRGGAFSDFGSRARISDRSPLDPATAGKGTGIRCAASSE
ncbi:MAG: formylglycine-generating enzyme family protein [bacterium]|nr:formylglycine-generating enzyme family protein [bacterium]